MGLGILGAIFVILIGYIDHAIEEPTSTYILLALLTAWLVYGIIILWEPLLKILNLEKTWLRRKEHRAREKAIIQRVKKRKKVPEWNNFMWLNTEHEASVLLLRHCVREDLYRAVMDKLNNPGEAIVKMIHESECCATEKERKLLIIELFRKMSVIDDDFEEHYAKRIENWMYGLHFEKCGYPEYVKRRYLKRNV